MNEALIELSDVPDILWIFHPTILFLLIAILLQLFVRWWGDRGELQFSIKNSSKFWSKTLFFELDQVKNNFSFINIFLSVFYMSALFTWMVSCLFFGYTLLINYDSPDSILSETNFLAQLKHDLFNPLIIFLSIFSVLIFKERTRYYEKWMYWANLYNTILQTDCSLKRSILKNALALDILDFGYWSHRSFKEFFENELLSACYKENSGQLNKKPEFNESSVRQVLEDRQKTLLGMSPQEHKEIPEDKQKGG